MSLFDSVKLLAQQQRVIRLQEENVRLWQRNALLAVRNQRDLLIFFIHAIDQEEAEWLRDELVGMLLASRNEISRLEEHIL